MQHRILKLKDLLKTKPFLVLPQVRIFFLTFKLLGSLFLLFSNSKGPVTLFTDFQGLKFKDFQGLSRCT